MNTHTMTSESVELASSSVKQHALVRDGGRTLVGLLFGAFLAVALMSPALRAGSFTWWPLYRFPISSGELMLSDDDAGYATRKNR